MVTGIASSLRGAIWKSLQSTEPNMKKKMVESSQGYFTQIRLNRIYGTLPTGDVSKQELQLFTELLCSHLPKQTQKTQKKQSKKQQVTFLLISCIYKPGSRVRGQERLV